MKKQDAKNPQSENLDKPKNEKKKLSRKTIVWINVIASALIVIVVPILIFLLAFYNPRLSWHGFTIANYKDYSAIGAVAFDSVEETATAYAAEGGKTYNKKLAGFINDNEYREIEFVNKKGKIVKQNAYLVHFDSYQHYSFMTFSTKKNQPFIDREFYSYSYQLSTDGKGGRIYFTNSHYSDDGLYTR